MVKIIDLQTVTSVYLKIGNIHAIWHLWPFFCNFQNFLLLWSQWNRCRRSIELYYSAPSGCVSSPRSWRWHVWQAQQSEKNDLKMLSVLLSVLLLGPITIIRLTDEFPSICGQLGLTATDPSKSQKERTRMLGLVVVSCVVVCCIVAGLFEDEMKWARVKSADFYYASPSLW